MEISINELAGYYANSNMAVADIYKAVIPPGYVRLNEKTTPEVCGIIIPLRGSACFKIKSTDYILSPGMIFHASPDLSIDRKALEGEPWCYYRIHFRIPKEERFKSPVL